MAVDLHTAQIQGFFDGPVDHLFALRCSPTTCASAVDRDRLTVVSPDAGRVRVAERWTDKLGGAAGHHPQAPRPERAQPGQGARGRR